MMEIDYKQLTLRDQKSLCEASGSSNLREFIAKVELQEPDALAAICWVLKKQIEPGFTLDQAYDLTMDDLVEMFGKNAGSGSEPASSTNSSDPSVVSITTPPRSSGSSRKRS